MRKNGTTFKVYVDDVAIAQSTSGTLNTNIGEIDITSKDSAAYKDIFSGVRDWSIDSEYLEDTGNSEDTSGLYSLWTNRTLVTLRFSDNTDGSKEYQGSAYITSLSFDTPLEDKISGSVTFTGTGALTESTLSSATFIVDGSGNNIVDGQGNFIVTG